MVVTLGQQYNVEKKPTVILYKYVNPHAGTPNTTITEGTIKLDTAQFVTLGLGSDGFEENLQLIIDGVCAWFLPIHSGHQVRWTYQPGSHRRKVTQDFSSTFFLRCVP